MGMIIFNGQSSRDYGIIIERRPPHNHGIRRGEAYQIAGRNGTFYREDGTFDNYIQPYDVAILEGLARRADLRAADVAAWLLGSSDYCRLEDGFEPEFFRMARYAGPLNIEQIMGSWGRCTLEFDCRPERWMRSGEEPVKGSGTDPMLFNPTAFHSKPLIKLFGAYANTLTLTVNGVHYLDAIGQGSSGPVVIDCDTGEITNAAGVNISGTVTFYGTYNELPTFQPGVNNISLNSYVTGFEIIPRWRTL